ncbi:MAG: hypothetical protein Q7T01_01910 [bacterium]|nr:hypothetical protein [bacterium]
MVIWEAGIRTAKMYLASGIIIPEGATPFRTMWSATIREIFTYSGATSQALVVWDASSPDRQDDLLRDTSVSLALFEQAVGSATTHAAMEHVLRRRN